MGTISRLNDAKKRLNEAESQMPGAYQSGYTDSIHQNLEQMAKQNAAGFDASAANDAYQQYRNNVMQNSGAGAAAAAQTASALSGGYGSEWAGSAASQAADAQTGAAGTGLAKARSQALQQWQNELNSTNTLVDTLLGQDALERSEYDGSVANAQNWRDYLSSRVDQARQENSDFWGNVWNGVLGVGNALRAGYDGYMGYSQQKLENEIAGYQLAGEAFDAGDPERAKQILKMYKLDETMVDQWSETRATKQNRVEGAQKALELLKAGSPEAAQMTLEAYGLDTGLLDNYQGLTDVQKEKLDYQLAAMDAESKYGNDTGVSNFMQMAGIDPNGIDYTATLNDRNIQNQVALQKALNSANLEYLRGQMQVKSQYSGSSGSAGSGSGSRSTGFTNSQLQQMAKDFSKMTGSEPLYNYYKQTLTDAGWLSSGTGTGSAGSGSTGTSRRTTGSGVTRGTTGSSTSSTSGLNQNQRSSRNPWESVDGMTGASTSVSGSARNTNFNTAVSTAQQMENEGYSMSEIAERLLREGYTDNVISRVSNVMGW